jgi:hypothetical protein
VKTDDELKQIAKDMWKGRIFTNRHCKDETLLGSIFMSLALGGLNNLPDEDVNDIGMVYEYLSEAGPRAINGYPMFMSCRLLSKADTTKVFDYYDKMVDFEKNI